MRSSVSHPSSIDLPERPGGNAGFTDADIAHYRDKFGHDPVYHRGPDGIKEAIDQVFRDMNKSPISPGVFSFEETVDFLNRFKFLYSESPRVGQLDLWPVTRDWLRTQLGPTIPVPD